jgi:predicted RNase H-like HicB family nuclease
MNTEKFTFTVAWSDEDGAYVASALDLPSCQADGQTPVEAVNNLQEVIGEWIETASEAGIAVPQPRSLQQLEKDAQEKFEEQQIRFTQEVQKAVQEIVDQAVPHIIRVIQESQRPSHTQTVFQGLFATRNECLAVAREVSRSSGLAGRVAIVRDI